MSGDTVLKPIIIENGFDRNSTAYQAKGRWIDGNKVRFSQGNPEKLGGWDAISYSRNYRGTARRAITWAALNGDKFYSVGSEQGLFLYSGGDWFDITPIARTATETSCINTYASNTTKVKVSDAAHGAVAGDYVVLSSVSDTGIDLWGVQEIVSVNTNNYVVSINSSSSIPNSTAKTKQGGAITLSYLLATGKVSNTPQTGYGSGTYGSGTYGTGSASGTLTNNMRLWSFDTWGEDLMALVRGGPIYRWDKSDGTGVRASVADTNIPTANNIVLVTEEARHMMVFGTSAFGGDFDPLAVRWSQSENYAVWSPAVTNGAGGFRLNSGSYIVGAVKSKKEIVAFTDEGAHAIVYQGAPFFFGQERLGIACGLVGPNAAVDVNGTMYWMGKSNFYMYDGNVKTIPCSLNKAVFEPDSDLSLNYTQKEMTYAGINSEFSEIWWFYPTRDVTENNRYVVYNYVTGEWYDGYLDRTTWVDSNLFDRPFATATSAKAYAHEITHDADGMELSSYLESGYFDIQDGQPMTFIDRLIPDVQELEGNYMKVYIKLRKHPSGQVKVKGPYTVGPNTEKISLRGRANQMALRIEVSSAGSDFRLGQWRMGIIPDGESK